MTTTLVPGDGAGLLVTQAGPGTSPGFSALDWRRSFSGGLQEGVVEADSFLVTERGSGANMSVDIAADEGYAYVLGDSVTAQGLYVVPPHSTTINEAITAADSTNPRIDQVILEIRDNTHDASGGNEARVRVVAGTPTSGATLANRLGVVALPGSSIRLAEVLVPASDTAISNSQIRDRRPWARGAYNLIVRNTNASSSDHYTTSSTSLSAVDATNLTRRFECSGVPVRISLRGQVRNSTASQETDFAMCVDGGVVNGGAPFRYQNAEANGESFVSLAWDYVPSVGSHTFAPFWKVGAGTATLMASSTVPLQLVIEELPIQDTANNATTSG